jgi:hypothetical protein
MEKSLQERLNRKNLVEVTEPQFSDEVVKVKSRSEVQRENSFTISSESLESFNSCIDVLGTTDLSEVRDLLPEEIDSLTSELLAVRAVKDITEGRETALKNYATSVVNLRLNYEGKDATAESGYLISAEHNVKLSKEVTGGKLNIDIDLLEQVLDEEQFSSITNLIHDYKTITYPDGNTVEETKVYRELNEEALEKQLKLGNVGMEQIIKATIPGKSRTAFYVRPIK